MGDWVFYWAPFVIVVVFVALMTVLGLWIRRAIPGRWGNISLPKPPSHGSRLSTHAVEEFAKALAEMAEREHDPTMASSFQRASAALSPVFGLSGFESITGHTQRRATWNPDEAFSDLRDAERAALSWLESQGAEAQVEVTDVLAGKVIEVVTQQGIEKIE